jgi:hypothetical protein
MGGFLSAPLACIDTMVQEHLLPHLWPINYFAERYRDDIALIFPTQLTHHEISSIHHNLNNLYGPDLSVNLESFSYTSLQFLERQIYLHNGNFVAAPTNKNIPLQLYTRYPHPLSSHPTAVLKGTVIGTFLRTSRIASTAPLKTFSTILNIWEFL